MSHREPTSQDQAGREERTRSLLASAAAPVRVDREKLWDGVELALASKRRSWLRPSLAAATVALVAGGAVTVAAWGGRTAATPAGSGTPSAGSSRSTPVTSRTPSTSSNPTAGSAATAGSTLPVLHPGMVLPPNQRYVDLTQHAWQHSPKGRTIGLGTAHLGGRPANVVLAPATLDAHASADGKARPAACVIVQPAKQPIDTWQVGGVVTTCVAFPVLDGPNAPGRDHLGEAALVDTAGSNVDELRDRQWPIVAASKDVATVDFVQDGRATRLPYRLTLPGIDGVLFTGFPPYGAITGPTSFGYDLRDDSGTLVVSARY